MTAFEVRRLIGAVFWRLFCTAGFVLAVVLLLGGCAGLSARASETDRCRELESSYRLWGGFSAASAALAGSGALSTALPKDEGARLGLGITSASVVAFGVAALFVRDDVLESWTAECAEDGAETIVTVETSTTP
jgi:hypothetical protein